MDEFLSEEDCRPNLNNVTLAGKVLKVERLAGKTSGIAFVVSYIKQWPNGGTQEVPIRAYTTGRRVDTLGWLKPGETVLIRGEIVEKMGVYARELIQLSASERQVSARA
jgi:hypothetical protein